MLADSFIREFSDGAVAFERTILDDGARRHNLDSEAEWGHRWRVAQLAFAGRMLSRGVAAVRRAPAPTRGNAGIARGLIADLLRSKHELLVENAMLRQLIVAARKVKTPRFRPRERVLLGALASLFTRWRSALVLVKPETLLEVAPSGTGHFG
ncbi:MAG: hypothetical protein JWN44_2119 [Myxococcales bacterium]|nr:hypothetical protein [Myxococcales bacterium]